MFRRRGRAAQDRLLTRSQLRIVRVRQDARVILEGMLPRRVDRAPTGSVQAQLVHFTTDADAERMNREDGYDRVVAVLRDDADLGAFALRLGKHIEDGGFGASCFYLRGPDEPYRTWPEIPAVYLLCPNEMCGDAPDGTWWPPYPWVFTDQATAERFRTLARERTGDSSIGVRTLPLGTPLVGLL